MRDVIDASVGGASDLAVRDRLVRRGYEELEILDLMDDLRVEGRLLLQSGRWRGPPPSEWAGQF